MPPISETEDKTCAITVHNVLGWDLNVEMRMLLEALITAAAHAPQAKVIDIYPQQREPADAPSWKHPGKLEWLVRIHYRSGGEMTIALVQRKPDAEIERHS